ncbi:MAG: hypothetical protein MRK02_06280 [Candidatus Scalindua sp.]|nr:hypothetical protein [Candidatus Scalindua sp.]
MQKYSGECSETLKVEFRSKQRRLTIGLTAGQGGNSGYYKTMVVKGIIKNE